MRRLLSVLVAVGACAAPPEGEIEIDGDIGPIVADAYAPGAPGPTVVLFHQGGGSARGEYGFLIPRLLDLGYAVLAADLHGGGDRFDAPNRTIARTPEPPGFTYCDALPSVRAVIDFARRWRPDARLVLWGSSYSGALVLHAAATDTAGLDRVLAFSPAGGEPMAGCAADDAVNAVAVPLLVVRPAREAAIPSVADQLARFAAAGHQAYVASPGAHGSSTLNPLRVGADVDSAWAVVAAFLPYRPAPAR